MKFIAEILSCNVEGGRYVLSRQPDGTYVATFHSSVQGTPPLYCIDRNLWVSGQDTEHGLKRFSCLEDAKSECSRHDQLRQIPDVLSWKDVFHVPNLEHNGPNWIRSTANRCGYRYYLLNDQVYLTLEGVNTGRTIYCIR